MQGHGNLNALEQVLFRAAREHDVATFLRGLVGELHARFGASGAAAWSYDPRRPGCRLTLGASVGLAEGAARRLLEDEACAWTERILDGGVPSFHADLTASSAPGELAPLVAHGVRGLAVLPLVADERPRGLLVLLWDRAPIESEQSALSSFAPRAAIALDLVVRLAAARESEENYRALMEGAIDSIFVIDAATGVVIAANKRAEEVSGLTRDQLLARHVWELPGGGDGLAIKNLFRHAIDHGELMVRAIPFVFPEGTRRWMDVSAKMVRFGGRQVVQAVARDVTEIYWLQERLKQYAKELERRVDEKTGELKRSQAHLVQSEKMAALGALVAGVAHEINTPVGSIVSNVHTATLCTAKVRAALAAASVAPGPELEKALRILEETNGITKNACDRIKGIVQNLRNFVRLDEGALKTVDVHEGIESSLAIIRHEMKDRVTVTRQFGEVPEVECHPNQINQVFLNLLVNAAQAIQGEGEIRIRTYFRMPWVAIEFQDTGCGIPPEQLDRIFEPGYTTKPTGIGTGLGLPIAQQILADHCGMIEVRSELGGGSTFTVLLPAKKC